MTTQPIPIACDMTDAPDTPQERLAEYQQLFADALIGRERLPDGAIRFRFVANPGTEDRVRALAAKEKACCGFFAFTISAARGEVWWDATTVDDPLARQILDEMHRLPESAGDGVAALFERFEEHGLKIVTDARGVTQPAATGAIDIGSTR